MSILRDPTHFSDNYRLLSPGSGELLLDRREMRRVQRYTVCQDVTGRRLTLTAGRTSPACIDLSIRLLPAHAFRPFLTTSDQSIFRNDHEILLQN